MVATGGPYRNTETLYTETASIPSIGSYTFAILDDAGDGICCVFGEGTWTVAIPGAVPYLGNPNFGAQAMHSFVLPVAASAPATPPLPSPPPSPAPLPASPAAPGATLVVGITTDRYPSETSWFLMDVVSQEVILAGGPYTQSEQTITQVVTGVPDGMYRFAILDSAGDGLCCNYGQGNYSLFDQRSGNVISSGSAFAEIADTTFTLPYTANEAPPRAPPPSPSNPPPVPSPPSPPPPNSCQNWCSRLESDWSVKCAWTSCRGCEPCLTPPPPTSPGGAAAPLNPPPCPRPPPPPRPPPSPFPPGPLLEVIILTDDYPAETSWELERDGIVIATGGPYTAKKTEHKTPVSLTNGAYTFSIYDSFSDGICCTYGPGSYSARLASSEVVFEGAQFGAKAVHYFAFPLSSNPPPAPYVTFPPSQPPPAAPASPPPPSYDTAAPPLPPIPAVVLTLTTDKYPSETSWSLEDGNMMIVATSETYMEAHMIYVHTIDLPNDGSYTLKVFDSFGDGMCCEYGAGGFELKYGAVVIASGAMFEYGAEHTFTMPLAENLLTPQPPLPLSPPPTLSPPPSPPAFPPLDPLTVVIYTDRYPGETQ